MLFSHLTPPVIKNMMAIFKTASSEGTVIFPKGSGVHYDWMRLLTSGRLLSQSGGGPSGEDGG